MISIQQAADELGISRAKIQRFIREGLEVTRKRGHVFVTLDAIRDWMALDAGVLGRTAPTLHPDDPRFRERIATIRLDRLKFEIAAGHYLDNDEAVKRFESECLALRGALLALGHTFASDAEVTPDAIAAKIEETLAEHLKSDDPDSWPAPQPLPPPPDIPSGEVEEGRIYSARYDSSDPRFAMLMAKADKAEAAYAALRATVTPLAEYLDKAAIFHGHTRKVFRAITADDIDSLDEAIRAALDDISTPAVVKLARKMRAIRRRVLDPYKDAA